MIKGYWQRVRLLAPAERTRWLTLGLLGAAIAALEGVGGAVVFSLLGVLSDPVRAGTVLGAFPLLARLSSPSPAATIVRIALLVAAVHLLKTLLVLLAGHWQARLTTTATATLSTRLLAEYLAMPYTSHLRRGSPELISNCLDAVQVFYLTLGLGVMLLTEVFVTIALVIVVASVVPGETVIAAAALALVLCAFVVLTRTVVRRWGRERYDLGTAVLGLVQQAFAGIKEIKLLGREAYFVGRVSQYQNALARLETRHATLSNSPRLLTETMFVIGMLALVLPLAGGAPQGTLLLPSIGIYAYAAFRVIPAVNRITQQVTEIRYGMGSTDALCADLATLGAAAAAAETRLPGAALPFARTLALEQVSYAYPGATGNALSDVTLEVHRGEWVGIAGPTGCGKSTLLDLMAGLLPAQSGRLTVDGVPMASNAGAWQQQVGYVPQMIFLLDDTLRRNITLGIPDHEIDHAQVERALRQAQLAEFVAALRDGLDTIVGERGVRLSGGERQRVAIARALYRDPAVLLFDEATASLDSATERELTRALETLHPEKTVVTVAHRLSTIASCDRIFVLRDGRVEASDTFERLLERSSTFRGLAAAADLAGG